VSVGARRRPDIGLGGALGLALTALALAGCHAARPPMHPESLSGNWYTVGEGESLDLIARRAGVPAEDILELNGLERAGQVHPGMLLFVLTSPAALAAPPPTSIEASLPAPALRWPLATAHITVGSPFGARDGRPHEGIDLPAPIGTPVFAAADGRVAYAGNGIRGYGNLVVVKHNGDLLTVYAHNSVLLVSEGQPVHAGDRIALVGQSGHATGPHLHFEVRRGQIPRDPMSYLPPLGSS
jgi:hypothetical protein